MPEGGPPRGICFFGKVLYGVVGCFVRTVLYLGFEWPSVFVTVCFPCIILGWWIAGLSNAQDCPMPVVFCPWNLNACGARVYACHGLTGGPTRLVFAVFSCRNRVRLSGRAEGLSV